MTPLAERLAPDTVRRLERAAQQRFATAEFLRAERRLAALYLYGFSAEIGLAAAYFRSAGFRPNDPIDRDMRQRRMAQARQLRIRDGEPIMTGEPRPLVGWARFLEYQRKLNGNMTAADAQRLREAINKAGMIYEYWRPELRYKILDVSPAQVDVVRRAAKWLVDNQERL